MFLSPHRHHHLSHRAVSSTQRYGFVSLQTRIIGISKKVFRFIVLGEFYDLLPSMRVWPGHTYMGLKTDSLAVTLFRSEILQ